jgi:O-acetyl-ADP-ribose deacetylase (regulator of RNase III)
MNVIQIVENLDTQTVREIKVSPILNKKVSLWHGDITRLEVDAIVSAVSSGKLHMKNAPRGSVRTTLHKAAGPMLERECQSLSPCRSGEAVVTSGYNLPAKCEII